MPEGELAEQERKHAATVSPMSCTGLKADSAESVPYLDAHTERS